MMSGKNWADLQWHFCYHLAKLLNSKYSALLCNDLVKLSIIFVHEICQKHKCDAASNHEYLNDQAKPGDDNSIIFLKCDCF